MSQTAATQNSNVTPSNEPDITLSLESELALSLIRSESNNAGLQLLETSSKNAGADLLQNTKAAIARLHRDVDAANDEHALIEKSLDDESLRITKMHEAAQTAILKRRNAARASFERQNNDRSTQIRALTAAVNVLAPKPVAAVATTPASVRPAAAAVHMGASPQTPAAPAPMTPAAAAAVASLQDGK